MSLAGRRGGRADPRFDDLQSGRCSQPSTSSAGTLSEQLLLLPISLSTSRCAIPFLECSSSLTPPPQFFEYNETPLFLQLSRQAVTKDLPVTIYESIVEIVNGEPEVVFVKAAYEVETGEAERVAVDHASKPSTTGSGTQSSRGLSCLSSQSSKANVLPLCSDREPLDAAQRHQNALRPREHHRPVPQRRRCGNCAQRSRDAPPDLGPHQQLARDRLVRFPRRVHDGVFAQEDVEVKTLMLGLLQEYNDVLLTTYLSTLTKQLHSANEVSYSPLLPRPSLTQNVPQLLDKQLLVVASSTGGGGGGAGIRGARRAGKADFFS